MYSNVASSGVRLATPPIPRFAVGSQLMIIAHARRDDEALGWVRRIHDPSFAEWEAHADWLEADPLSLDAFDEASLTIEAATAGLLPARAALPIATNDNIA